MKNILVISEAIGVNGSSAGIGRSKLIKLLHESGNKVTVITRNNFIGDPSWLSDEIIVKKFDLSFIRESFLDRIPKVKAIPFYFTGFSNSFRYNKKLYKRIINEELSRQKYDLIYALAAGTSFVPHFALSEMVLDIPFYVNIHDPYPAHVYPEPYKSPKNRVNSIQEKKFRKVLDKAKGISFPSLLLKEDMAKVFPVINEKGFVIPHLSTSFTNLPDDDLQFEYSLNFSKINIIHAGTLLGPRNPKFLLKAIEELNQEDPSFLNKVSFTFVGNVNKNLTETINNTSLSNVCFVTSRLSYQKSLDIIAQSDASFVIEAIADYSPFLPGKVADIVFAEKPILGLGPKNSELRRLLGESYLYQSELDDINSIKVVLNQFYNDYINNKIENETILQLKEYLSIERNSKNVNQFFRD